MAPEPVACFVVLGRQGSGKGTQCELLESKTGVIHISTGVMLRKAVEAGTEIGKQAKAIMDSGNLVGDEIMCGIVSERLAQDDVIEKGTVLDGFPRTPAQAEALTEILEELGIELRLAINLEVDDAQVIERMLERGRDDDTQEVIERRLQLYEQETAPLLDWFNSRGLLKSVDGSGTPEEVFENLSALVSS